MRNKGKFELYLSSLSRDEQDFVARFGAKALENRAMFEIAREIHWDIKLKKTTFPRQKLFSLFVDAIERNDFKNVRALVELLEDWTGSAVEHVEGLPGFGFGPARASDPVSAALLERSRESVRLSDKPFDFKHVTLKNLKRTARQILALIKFRAPGFECDIKTIRNRAKELGLKLAPDKRGLRK